MKPIVTVINDYDGYFENWANGLAEGLEKAGNQHIKEITVDSGPYRSDGLTYRIKDNVVHLDFYAAVRRGFGSIGVTTSELADELIMKTNKLNN